MQLNSMVIMAVVGIQVPAISQSAHSPSTLRAVKMNEIPTNIGSPFQLQEEFTEKINSGNKSDVYKFENARVGKIEQCILIYETVQDTIVTITLLLTGEKSREQARQQADKQFGTARFGQNEMMSVYGWLHESPEGKVSISLAYTDRDPTSEMFIKKME